MKNTQSETIQTQEPTSKKSNTVIQKNIPGLILFLVIILTIFGTWYVTHMSFKRTITVTGSSVSQVSNEVAEFTLSIESRNVDKQMASQDAADKARVMTQMLKDINIKAEDIQTSNISIFQVEEPYFEDGVTKYEKGDWVANYSITVTVRDLKNSLDVTSILNSVENGNVWGPNLRTDDSKVMDETQLLTEAIKDAENKANIMAKATGQAVVGIVSIVEGSAINTDNNGMLMYSDKMSGMGGGAGMPIESGSSRFIKNVTVTFRLVNL